MNSTFRSVINEHGEMEHVNDFGDVAVYGEFGRDTYGVIFANYPGVMLCARGGLDAASRLAEKFNAGWRPVNWLTIV